MTGLRVPFVLDGKQREIQAREQHFLEVARDILVTEGYQALTVARVAKERCVVHTLLTTWLGYRV